MTTESNSINSQTVELLHQVIADAKAGKLNLPVAEATPIPEALIEQLGTLTPRDLENLETIIVDMAERHKPLTPQQIEMLERVASDLKVPLPERLPEPELTADDIRRDALLCAGEFELAASTAGDDQHEIAQVNYLYVSAEYATGLVTEGLIELSYHINWGDGSEADIYGLTELGAAYCDHHYTSPKPPAPTPTESKNNEQAWRTAWKLQELSPDHAKLIEDLIERYKVDTAQPRVEPEAPKRWSWQQIAMAEQFIEEMKTETVPLSDTKADEPALEAEPETKPYSPPEYLMLQFAMPMTMCVINNILNWSDIWEDKVTFDNILYHFMKIMPQVIDEADNVALIEFVERYKHQPRIKAWWKVADEAADEVASGR